jgi:hypothetical protein
MWTYVDREAPTATTGSYQVAMNHESSHLCGIEDPWTRVAKMSNAEESKFLPTSGTAALYSIKFYSQNLSVSTAYGMAFVVLLIQFRARR